MNNMNKVNKDKIYITRYEIFKSQKSKGDRQVLFHILKRNLKPKFRDDYKVDEIIKHNIGYYSLEEFLDLIYHRVLKHKSENKIYKLYKNFIEFIKNNESFDLEKLSGKSKMILNNFPKPKYERKGWKKYYQLKQEINRLKKAKRKVKKKYSGSILTAKLNNIDNEITQLIQRRNEVLNELGESI